MKKQESMIPKKRSRWKRNKYTFTEEGKIFDLMEKDFQYINMFKELKVAMSEKLKENMKIISH